MADNMIPLLPTMAASLRQSDLAICQIVAAALQESANQSNFAIRTAPLDITPTTYQGINQQLAQNYSGLHLDIQRAMPYLVWRRPGFGRIPDRIATQMAVCEIVGPTGQSKHQSVRAGLLFQGADMTYPRHSHAAEEIYFLLSGPVDWQINDANWHEQGSGDFVHHLPYQPHTIRTGTTPLLALWGWVGNIGADSYQI